MGWDSNDRNNNKIIGLSDRYFNPEKYRRPDIKLSEAAKERLREASKKLNEQIKNKKRK